MKKYIFEAIGRDSQPLGTRVERSVLACEFMSALEPMKKDVFKPLNRVVAMMNDSVISPGVMQDDDLLSSELPYEMRPLDILESISPQTPDRSQLGTI